MNKSIAKAMRISLPPIGQGACFMGELREAEPAEKAALLCGIEHGMSLIDTAESYGGGRSEALIGSLLNEHLIAREDIILTTKVSPENSTSPKLYKSCENSLRRLCTDHIDLYLLHWRGGAPLAEAVDGFEALKKQGKILHWGVSNFDVTDMEDLWRAPAGDRCAADQVLYNLGSRGVEYDLMPWLMERGVAMMAYCPLAQGGKLRRMGGDFQTDITLASIARKYGVSAFAVMLAFVIKTAGVCAIPKAAQTAHVIENAKARALAGVIECGDWNALDAVYLPPTSKMHLDSD